MKSLAKRFVGLLTILGVTAGSGYISYTYFIENVQDTYRREQVQAIDEGELETLGIEEFPEGFWQQEFQKRVREAEFQNQQLFQQQQQQLEVQRQMEEARVQTEQSLNLGLSQGVTPFAPVPNLEMINPPLPPPPPPPMF